MNIKRVVPLFSLWAVAAIGMTQPALATQWQTEKDRSNLTFEVTQMGSPITGQFGRFDADITFDPQDLDQASVGVTIDLKSVDTGNGDRDASIKGSDWFNTADHPTAVFRSTGFASDDVGYLIEGELTIRGITKPVQMLAAIDVDGNSADATGELAVVRTDFDVGTGQWASDAAVGTTVTIRFEIHARAEN